MDRCIRQFHKALSILLLIYSVAAFADTTTYICDYPTYSDQEGNHKVKDKFVLTFIVDKAANKTYMLGNLGSTEIRMLESVDQIAFIDVTGTGNIMTTAIDAHMNSVHSRKPDANFVGSMTASCRNLPIYSFTRRSANRKRPLRDHGS